MNLKVLQFHKILNRFYPGGTYNTPGQFENFIKTISNLGFVPVLPQDLKDEHIVRPIIITFDDGDVSLYQNLTPIVREYKIKVLVFLITGYIGKENRWDLPFLTPRGRHLDWNEILEMHAAGIEFGSHTVTHPDLTRLSQDELEYELNYSKEILEKNIGPIHSISFPFNRVNNPVINAARRAGYQFGFGGFSVNNFPMAIAKEPIYVTDNCRTLKIKITGRPKLFYQWERIKSRWINLFSLTTILLRHYD